MDEDRYDIKDLIYVNQIGRIRFDISGIPQLTKLSLNNSKYNPNDLKKLSNTEFFCPLYNQLYYEKGELSKQFINFKNSDVSSNDLLKKVTNQKIMGDFIKKTFFKQGKNLNFNNEQINEFKKKGTIKIEQKLLLNNALIILNKIILKNKNAVIYYKKPNDARNRQYYLTSLPFDINNVNIDDINDCPNYSKIQICKVSTSKNVIVTDLVTKLYEKDKEKIKNKNNEQIKLFKEAFSHNEAELTKKLRVLKDQENRNITKSVIIYDIVKKILNKADPNKLGYLDEYLDISGNDKIRFENLIESERNRIVDNYKEYKGDNLFEKAIFKKYIENIVQKYFEEKKKLKNYNSNSNITLELLLTIDNLEKIQKSIFSRNTWREKYEDTHNLFKEKYKKTKKQLNDYKKKCKELDKSGEYTIKEKQIIDNCKLLCGHYVPPYSIVDCSNNHLSCNICKQFVNCSFGTNIDNRCKTKKSESDTKKSESDIKKSLLSNLFKIQSMPVKTLKYPTNIIAFGNPPILRGGKKTKKYKKPKKYKKTKQKKSYKRHRTIKRYKKYNKRKTYKR